MLGGLYKPQVLALQKGALGVQRAKQVETGSHVCVTFRPRHRSWVTLKFRLRQPLNLTKISVPPCAFSVFSQLDGAAEVGSEVRYCGFAFPGLRVTLSARRSSSASISSSLTPFLTAFARAK